MKFDLSRFKKVSSDKHSTTLKHDQGHTIKLAHAPLSPKLRGQLHALPMADGGDVGPTGFPKIEVQKGQFDADAKKLAGDQPKPSGYEQGGSVETAEDKAKKVIDAQGYDQLGNKVPENVRKTHIDQANVGLGNTPKPSMAEGGDPKAPVVINIGGQGMPSPEQFAKNAANVNSVQTQQAQDAKPYGTGDVMMGSGEPMAPPMPSQPPSNNIPQPPAPPAPEAPQAATPEAQPPTAQPSAAQPDTFGNLAGGEAYTQGLSTQLGGMSQQAEAEKALGSQQAQAAKESGDVNQRIESGFNQQMTKLNGMAEGALQAVKEGHIQPDHYTESKSTLGRIGTAIGLISAGFGGPASVDNAVSNLNRQIDRDVQAQMSNQNIKENVFTGLLKQMGNVKEAAIMASALNSKIYADQINQAMGQTQDMAAKARLSQASGALMQQASDRIGQLSMLKTLQEGNANGIVPPEMLIRFNPLVPPAEKPAAMKQLQEAQDAASMRDHTLSAFDQMAKINTVGNRLMSPIQAKKQVDALKNTTLDKLTKDTSGRVTPETVKLIGSAFDTMLADPATVAIQRQAINNLVSQNMNYPLLKNAGIDINSMGRYDKNGQPRLRVSPAVRR